MVDRILSRLKEMKTRSPFEICAPLVVFLGACMLSVPTLVLAIAWMTLGVCFLGYRTLDDFPTVGVPRKWLRGMRGGCLLFYHLAWWPWYMRKEICQVARMAAQRLARGRSSRERRTRASRDDSKKDR
jgi:hypothetical protein